METKEKLKQIYEILGNDTVTPAILRQFLVLVLDRVKQHRDEMVKMSEERERKAIATCSEMIKDCKEMLQGFDSIKADHETERDNMVEKMETMLRTMNEIVAKASTLKDGQDGQDGSPDSPAEVRDKLQDLKKGQRLTIDAIEDLPRILTELSKKTANAPESGEPRRIATGALVRFIDDETPVGTVNGVNTAFKVTKTPKAGSLKVYRNGARQRITEDYTFDGLRTITFLIAPQVGEILLVDYRY